jgi:hypothetical protein
VARIRGPRLSEIPRWELEDPNLSSIIREIMEKINSRGVLLNGLSGDQFVVEQQTGRVILFDFLGMVNDSIEKQYTVDFVEEILQGLRYD